ncbi:U6 small nuclear RNA (adenine-(43)-N(6))-methyltransferase-like protein [Drosera capensis]
MPNKKRKRNPPHATAATIHPRNKYANNPPDFSLLASLYPAFAHYVFQSRDGRPKIDWTDFGATRELTRVLLHHDHGLNWWIPDGQLCPTVPNRSNYIHWIEDLLASNVIFGSSATGDKVRGFDIGTGANCIYPLLGASLLGWSFVATDVTDVALECAHKNVSSNPHISALIEIRKVDNLGIACDDIRTGSNGIVLEENSQSNQILSDASEAANIMNSSVASPESNWEDRMFNGESKADLDQVVDGEAEPNLSTETISDSDLNTNYSGPQILLGIVKEGERFDFCMCNPPFFESMEEAGQNPKTSCGGTPEEMVCPGGERAFISRLIEDSVVLRESFRWYTSMVGKKSSLKFLISKLREVGVTVVKTTEFVQGQTCRWGLAWSFLPPARKLLTNHLAEKTNLSFMLEGVRRQASAFDVLQSVESFFCGFSASCKSNPSSFTVDVHMSAGQCEVILMNEANNFREAGDYQELQVPSVSSESSPSDLGFRVSVFQQIPGTLLVKGSVQQKQCSPLRTFSSIFLQLEDFLKERYHREKTRT